MKSIWRTQLQMFGAATDSSTCVFGFFVGLQGSAGRHTNILAVSQAQTFMISNNRALRLRQSQQYLARTHMFLSGDSLCFVLLPPPLLGYQY